MFIDQYRQKVWQQLRQHDLRAFACLLTPALVQQAARQAGVSLGRGILNRATLLWLAISAALRPGRNFARVLVLTLRLLREMDRLPPRPRRRRARPRRSKHDPRSTDGLVSEEAFAQARALMPASYWVAVILLLGQAFASRHDAALRWQGFRLLVLDGTCLSLPRYRALGEHFGYARNQRRTPRPQARMVMLLWAQARLPWRYELTPRSQGESTLAARLLSALDRDDLVLMDRGFFHYGLFRQIHEAGAFFAIRRIKRLRLRTLVRWTPHERLVRWRPAARRWQGAELRLRVIDYQIPGFRKSAIVTNMLDPQRLSRAHFVGLSRSGAWVSERDVGLYHRRWQIETAFREMKRVQQLQGGLRGRTPATISYEVAGHVLLYLLVRWLMVEAAQQHGRDPLRLSFTETLHELQEVSLLLPLLAPRQRRRLLQQTLRRIASWEVPYRPGRHYPRPADGRTRYTGAGHPILPARLRPLKT
jgi:hypothetical protein